jgi:hypothetical protein
VCHTLLPPAGHCAQTPEARQHPAGWQSNIKVRDLGWGTGSQLGSIYPGWVARSVAQELSKSCSLWSQDPSHSFRCRSRSRVEGRASAKSHQSITHREPHTEAHVGAHRGSAKVRNAHQVAVGTCWSSFWPHHPGRHV